MRELDIALTEGLWAIAATAAGKYVGQLWGADHVGATKDKEYFVSHLTNPMKMKWALEFSSNLVPRAVRTADGGQAVVFDRNIQVNSIGHCLDVERLVIYITPVDLFFLDDMSKFDKDWHQNMIRDGVRNTLSLRLREAGIIDPSAPHVQEGNA